ncbi:FMN-binding protein [Dermacoccaceae bacterium W4C1]
MSDHLTRRRIMTLALAAPALALAACSSDDSGSDSTSAAAADTTAADTSSAETSAADSSAADSGEYKAGSYDAEGSYDTPGGEQSVEVEMTLTADGTVSEVTVTPQAESGNSVQFQNKFASGISAEVKGKKIDDLNVSKVSGSSLTSGGFNAAVEKIKTEAAA